MTVPDSNSLDLTTGMTLEAWVYPTANGSWRDVVYEGWDDVYYLEASSDTGTPATGALSLNGSLTENNVLPLVPPGAHRRDHDGANVRLYVNGVQAANRPRTGNIATSTGSLTIGGDPLYGQHFVGRIDEVTSTTER